jgi:hypothetical protein
MLHSKTIGKKFNNLTVLSIEKRDGHSYTYFKCVCDCGNTKTARADVIKKGGCKSCGCLRQKVKINDKFNKLTVIEKDTRKSTRNRTYWLCKCDCGNYSSVLTYGLYKNKILSCGCTRKSKGWKKYKSKYPGELRSYIWSRMKKHAEYRNLEFSITPIEAWNLFLKQDRKCALTGIELFFVSNAAAKLGQTTASLDRIDSSRGYILDNIQWIHKDLQFMKSDFTQEEFIKYCHLVSNLHSESRYDQSINR